MDELREALKDLMKGFATAMRMAGSDEEFIEARLAKAHAALRQRGVK